MEVEERTGLKGKRGDGKPLPHDANSWMRPGYISVRRAMRCDAVRSVQSVGRSYIVVTEMQTCRDGATATSSRHREGPADT